MNPMLIILYFISLGLLIAGDLIWFGVIARDFYKRRLGHLLAPKINWLAAGVFYIIFASGLMFFIVVPALERESWVYAFAAGSFFGFVAYATYDITNMAVTKDWPFMVGVIDLLWGTVIAGSVSVISYVVGVVMA